MVSSFRPTAADRLEIGSMRRCCSGPSPGVGAGALEAALEAARRDGLVSGWVWRQSVDDWLEGMPVRVTLLEAEGHEAPSLRLSEPLARQLGRTAGGALAWPGRLPDGEFLAPYYRSYGGGRLELEMPRALWGARARRALGLGCLWCSGSCAASAPGSAAPVGGAPGAGPGEGGPSRSLIAPFASPPCFRPSPGWWRG